MGVVISDEILQVSQLTASEFRQEIALYLFQTGRLTLGYASHTSGYATQRLSPTLETAQHPTLLLRC